jgi:hypothetical protein
MELHTEALFTHDEHLRLLAVNEPWPVKPPAPRFFLGRSMAGAHICRLRYDIPGALAAEIAALCDSEPPIQDVAKPLHLEAYMRLFHAQQFSMALCFLIPETAIPSMQVVGITPENAGLLHGGFEWLIEELAYAQPCVAVVAEGRAVSVCRSVRITSRAHEAGLETLAPFRGKGYAAQATAGWAMAVRAAGCIPLYSTSAENLSSQSVATRLGLELYGVSFSIS